MNKKAILSTLLISSALLGTSAAHAATSAVKPEKKLVTVQKTNAKLYSNSKLEKSTTVKAGTVYKVNGYRDINGKKYYRVYQQDTKGKNVYKGYLLDKDAKDLQGQAPTKADRFVGVTASKAPAWKNLYFNIKIKDYNGQKHSSNFEVKTMYKLGDKTYYSLYRDQKWMGYMDSKDTEVLTPQKIAEDKQDYQVIKAYDTYRDIYFTKNGKATVDQKVKVKNIYTFGTGRKYASIYNAETGKWIGYINVDALKHVDKEETLEKEIAKVKTQAQNVYLTKEQENKLHEVLTKIEKVTSKDTTNFNKAKNVLIEIEKKLTAQPNETDGKALYQALQDYSEFEKVKDQLSGFDTIKTAKEAADKVMVELKKDQPNHNEATVAYTGEQVRKVTKDLNDAYAKVTINVSSLQSAIQKVKEAMNGKQISEADKAKLNTTIQKAEEAAKNNTLSASHLKAIQDSTKAMEEAAKQLANVATPTQTKELQSAINEVEKINQHSEVKEMISTKYNDLNIIKKDFADAKSIVDGTKTATTQEISTLKTKLVDDAKNLKLKKGTMINNINYAKDMLKNKDQYLPAGVTAVENEIKTAEAALEKNTLENYTAFQAAKEAVLKAPSQLKKNATTNINGLKTLVSEVQKLESIKGDIASKGDQVKTAYNNANNLVKETTEQLKTTPASDVTNAQKALENSVANLSLNNKRLNAEIKAVTEDAQKYYLSSAEETTAKQKLTPIVDAGKKAKTVKAYADYDKAVKALEKTDQDMQKEPTKASVTAIEKEYQQVKEKCASWKKDDHKGIFTPETEKPFEDALKAIEMVGKAAEAKGEIQKSEISEAEKAAQAANNLKFNAPLINQKVNEPAQKMVEAAKDLNSTYLDTTATQSKIISDLSAASTALADTNLNAIKDGKWNKKSWNAIKAAEDKVVKDGKFLQTKLKTPLQNEKTKGEEALKTSIVSGQAALQSAIQKAEDDLNNNNYAEFAKDKQAIADAIKKAPENGKAEAATLQETISQVDQIKAKVPADDFAKSSFDNIKTTYEKAKQIVTSPESYTKQQVTTANTNLENAAKGLKLNVDKLKREGKQFQDMVGATGDGGTYYIDNSQKSKLQKQKSGQLNTTYEAGIKASTLAQFATYDKADKELQKAIKDVEDNCPTMANVREVRSFVKELKNVGITDDTAKKHQDFFEKSDIDALQSDLQAIKKVADAVPLKNSISKSDVAKGLETKLAFEALTINVTDIEKLNNDVLKYEKAAYEAASSKTDYKDAITNAVKAVNNALDNAAQDLQNPSDIKVVKVEDSTLKWNTTGIQKVATAENKVKEKVKALAQQVQTAGLNSTVQPEGLLKTVWSTEFAALLPETEESKPVANANVITEDTKILNDPVALCRIVMDSEGETSTDKAAKNLAKLLDEVAYPVWVYSTGNKVISSRGTHVYIETNENDENNPGLENNMAWTKFEKNGSGHYYQAIELLQKYAKNKNSIDVDQCKDMMDYLISDFQGMNVITTELDKLVKEEEKTLTTRERKQDTDLEKAKECIENPKLDNWKKIVELTKKLKAKVSSHITSK